ncbi:hypothetical protein P154DRAFT_573104 [Amniculicola lignicola CBS 123094]|uniref:Uncharacterized protein n=1 Tax=Amniculicola lignicola CBS 123094 TaxID=1392246 RepID=A0A6A5WRF3_9PLEO|nr:hypothetical protein P154DRAFT_573104 [Amniculicola lignicola CBS 123094]
MGRGERAESEGRERRGAVGRAEGSCWIDISLPWPTGSLDYSCVRTGGPKQLGVEKSGQLAGQQPSTACSLVQCGAVKGGPAGGVLVLLATPRRVFGKAMAPALELQRPARSPARAPWHPRCPSLVTALLNGAPRLDGEHHSPRASPVLAAPRLSSERRPDVSKLLPTPPHPERRTDVKPPSPPSHARDSAQAENSCEPCWPSDTASDVHPPSSLPPKNNPRNNPSI